MSDAGASISVPNVAATRQEINRWIIAVTVTLATFMELLDTAIANVALPHIAGGLAVSYDESTWVLTSYLVSNAVVLPLSAWFSRVFGRKRYYMLCVLLFTLSSVLCGLAPSLGLLIFFRVLLARGQIEDGLESRFIVLFFSVAVLALIAAAVWEWRHPDPVVEIRLLANRNFAIANVYYFLFGFALFGSTVLIPQMLQTLYGYTATDAGLVLGPGAFVIVALAPVIVRILPKVGTKPLIFAA